MQGPLSTRWCLPQQAQPKWFLEVPETAQEASKTLSHRRHSDSQGGAWAEKKRRRAAEHQARKAAASAAGDGAAASAAGGGGGGRGLLPRGGRQALLP